VSDEQHVALPHLFGGPAYSRPPRPVAEIIPRPFDPDELPIEAARSDEDADRAAQLKGSSWAPTILPAAKAKSPRRTRAAKAGKAAASGAAAGAASPPGAGSAGPSHGNGNGHAGLQGRPLRLRGLGRILGAARK
jgi:hypothetical protein